MRVLVRHAGFIAGLGLLLPLAGAALADGSVCVYCTEPSQTYICAFDPNIPVGSVKYADKALPFVCVDELAKYGHHASCRVEREPLGNVCNGVRRYISVPQDAAVPPADPGAGAGASASAGASPTPPSAIVIAPPGEVKREPQTVEEMAKKAMASSGEDMKAAGKSFNRQIKKSWDCLVSLFQNC